jgi:hypothetical protein
MKYNRKAIQITFANLNINAAKVVNSLFQYGFIVGHEPSGRVFGFYRAFPGENSYQPPYRHGAPHGTVQELAPRNKRYLSVGHAKLSSELGFYHQLRAEYPNCRVRLLGPGLPAHQQLNGWVAYYIDQLLAPVVRVRQPTGVGWIPVERGLPPEYIYPGTALHPHKTPSGWSVQVQYAYTYKGEPKVGVGACACRNFIDGYQIGDWDYPGYQAKFNKKEDPSDYGAVTHYAFLLPHPSLL